MNLPVAPPSQAGTLTPGEFEIVARIARAEAGLNLSPGKASMIGSRLGKRLRATGHATFAAYLAALDGPGAQAERKALINALTTNVSHFFRENHHFDILLSEALPPLVETARRGGRIRIWSAGCSTGQEPYSIAMAILARWPEAAGWDLRILATDIDDTVLQKAVAGQYAERLMQGVDDPLRRRFFSVRKTGEGDLFEVRKELRDIVTFRALNLVGAWPLRGPFDVIFCRNVVIYFDSQTQNRLWPRFAQVLRPGGWLFLGHSERVAPGAEPALVNAGVTAYRRTDAVRAAS